jgi:tetratricopeptide (TPR) repeat protein
MDFAVPSLRRSLVVLVAIVALWVLPSNSIAQKKGGAEKPVPPEPAAPTTQFNAKELLQQGTEALDKKDYETALKAFGQLTAAIEQPGKQQAEASQYFSEAYTGLGRAFVGMREFESALGAFKQVIDAQPTTDALIARGQLYLETGDNDRALRDFQNAVNAERGNIAAQFGLGKAYILLGGWQQGVTALTRVIAAQPENAEALKLRGWGYNGLLKNKEAVADLEQSITLNPDDYEAHYYLGAIQLRTKDYQGAVDQLGKAIELYKPKAGAEDQPYLIGYLTRATAFIELGKATMDEAARKATYQAAVDEASKAVSQLNENDQSLGPARATALYSRGVGERLVGNLAAAIRTFTQAIELNPEFGEAYFRRGICFHMIGEDKMAIADFQQASHINYDDPRANLWEGFTYAKLGEYHEALRAYGDAIAASDRYTPAYANRGRAYMMLGEYEKAIKDFDEAIRLEPGNAEYYFVRGVAYEQLRNNQKAADSFAAAIEFDKKHAGAYRHLAAVEGALGRSELSSQYQQKADELAPKTNAK